MTREIKFRAWDKEEKEYYYNAEYTYDFRCSGRGCYADSFGELLEHPERYKVEQYTGLKDKNGKEIYEGDIVEEVIDFNSKMTDGIFRYKVYWNEDELCWSLDPIGPESIHNDLWELNSSRRVIGNVHEDRELLEKGE